MSLPPHQGATTSGGPSRRMTKQKRAVYENVMQRCDHPTAKDIHADLESTGIGLATVYRNLAVMAEDGIRDPLWSRGLGDVYKRQLRRFLT